MLNMALQLTLHIFVAPTANLAQLLSKYQSTVVSFLPAQRCEQSDHICPVCRYLGCCHYSLKCLARCIGTTRLFSAGKALDNRKSRQSLHAIDIRAHQGGAHSTLQLLGPQRSPSGLAERPLRTISRSPFSRTCQRHDLPMPWTRLTNS